MGLAVAVLLQAGGKSSYAPAAGWIAAAAIYLGWTWRLLLPMDAEQTRRYSTQLGAHESSVSRLAHGALFAASLASLLGVAELLRAETGKDTAAAVVGVLSVSASWLTIHTIFMLRYAGQFYNSPDWRTRPHIDFNEDGFEPSFLDFAYLAFTVGMSYSVSDTGVRGTETRRVVLTQALVSFALGAIIISIAINLVASLVG